MEDAVPYTTLICTNQYFGFQVNVSQTFLFVNNEILHFAYILCTDKIVCGTIVIIIDQQQIGSHKKCESGKLILVNFPTGFIVNFAVFYFR